MTAPRAEATQRVLEHFGLDAQSELGRGGEAVVYALDSERVLRVPHEPWRCDVAERRRTFLAELRESSDRVPFALPDMLELVELGVAGVVSIEGRLPGRSLMSVLGEVTGAPREQLIRAHLDAAGRIGDIRVERPYFGDVDREDPIRTSSFRDYLERRAARSLALGPAALAHVAAPALAQGWPEPESPALVHLDAFAGNMLTDGASITAVIDFGEVSIIGDRRLDPLLAATYLAPPITSSATLRDQAVCREWLTAQGLDELYEPARRWAAAYWSFAQDDAALSAWCQSVLSGD
jgi:hypothetical protein